MAPPSTLPRYSLGLLALLHATVFGWAAWILPWGGGTPFAGLSAGLAILYVGTGLAALAGARARGRLWRMTAIASLAFLAYHTWLVFDAATYIAVLYGGLGQGVAVGMAAVWAVLVLFTVPLSVWGIAVTGGIRRRRPAAAGAALLALLATLGLWRSAAAAADRPLAPLAASPEALLPALAEIAGRMPPNEGAEPPSLMTREPARCDRSPLDAEASAIITYHRRTAPPDPELSRPATICVQGRADGLLAAIEEALEDAAVRGPTKVDVIVAASPLTSSITAPDFFQVRPGTDGVCRHGRCFMPWQLVALDEFTSNAPLAFIDDFRFGIDSRRLAAAFSGGAPPEERIALDGLTRITTWSYLIDRDGEARYTPRLREQDVPLTAATLERAVSMAMRHILAAQASDGRFRYLLNPWTGHVSWQGFAVPRQAGTTLAICEIGDRSPEVDRAVRASLAMLTGIEEKSEAGGVSALAQRFGGKKPRNAGLGNTALSMIALLTCRDRVGDEFDPAIGRLGRFLLTMMRPDGGFYPAYSLAEGHVIEGPDPLYAEGQAVYALSLLEAAAAIAPDAPFPPADELRTAVEKAMEYTATTYWNHGLYDFFFIEENWHCLAARASLGHHRNLKYEEFCLDYVEFKKRLIYDEASDGDPAMIGAYGFGNVIPPHNTPSGGFGEALAAAMAIRIARGESIDEEKAIMARVATFLIRQQWRPELCFACAEGQVIEGGWSESWSSPVIRIDYVQHAMAGLGHGGRFLDLDLDLEEE
ncbi:MAG: hypothetical protein H6710_00310 [Myxococcales bacterium]|nr:hypothetical protein [Myxococcales bacterium]